MASVLDETEAFVQIDESITQTEDDIMSVQVMGDMPKIIAFEDEYTIQV